MEWTLRFGDAGTRNLDYFGSDHRPVVCTLDNKSKKVQCKGKGRFHFEEKWFLDKSFVPDFLCEWEDTGYEVRLQNRLALCENILEATVGSNASYIWRSLMWSKDLIEKGCIWRVGDGSHIKVFGDKWVTGLVDGRLTDQSEDGRGRDMCVKDLLDEEGAWRRDMICDLVLPHEAAAIFNTPVGEQGVEDEWRWKYEEKGLFMVKSAYLLQSGYYEGNAQNSGGDRKLWSRLVWSLKVPPKIRVFL